MNETEIPKSEVPAQLFCQICSSVIPEDKAKRRSNTCGKKECVNALRRYRAAVLASGKCPHCYHPSTPEEWLLFRQFRQWHAKQNDTTLQSFMKATSGMTLRALARKLAKELANALQATEARKTLILEQSTMKKAGKPDLPTLPANCATEIAILDERIQAWRQLVDSAGELLPEKVVDAKAAD